MDNIPPRDVEVIGTTQAAESLGVAVNTISRWVQKGKLRPAGKGSGRNGAYYFHRADVELVRAEELAKAQDRMSRLSGLGRTA